MADSGILYRPKHVALYHLLMYYRYCCNRLPSCLQCCSFITAKYHASSKMIKLCLTSVKNLQRTVCCSGSISPFFLDLNVNFKSLPSRSDRFILGGNSLCYTFCRTLGRPPEAFRSTWRKTEPWLNRESNCNCRNRCTKIIVHCNVIVCDTIERQSLVRLYEVTVQKTIINPLNTELNSICQ